MKPQISRDQYQATAYIKQCGPACVFPHKTTPGVLHSGKGFLALPLIGQRPIVSGEKVHLSAFTQVGLHLCLASNALTNGSCCTSKGPLSQVRKLS